MCRVIATLGVCLSAAVFPASAETLVVPRDFSSIQDAVNAAERGDTIRIEEGEYEESVQLKSRISLIGAGRDFVTIRAKSEDGPVLSADRCEDVTVRGLTLELISEEGLGRALSDEAPVCRVRYGSIVITDCEIRGSRVSGIAFEMSGHSIVDNCYVHNNAWSGILVRWGARATIRNSYCVENGRSGISFFSGGSGIAEDNTASENRVHGISVVGKDSAPILRRNECNDNGRNGIYYADNAGGEASGNSCERNGSQGISISGSETKPLIADNKIRRNKVAGVGYARGATSDQIKSKREEIAQAWLELLFHDEEFESLENVVQRLRDEKSRFSGGAWELPSFYQFLVPPVKEIKGAAEQDFFCESR